MDRSIGRELDGIDLGDERLNRRSRKVLEANPQASINAACQAWSDTGVLGAGGGPAGAVLPVLPQGSVGEVAARLVMGHDTLVDGGGAALGSGIGAVDVAPRSGGDQAGDGLFEGGRITLRAAAPAAGGDPLAVDQGGTGLGLGLGRAVG